MKVSGSSALSFGGGRVGSTTVWLNALDEERRNSGIRKRGRETPTFLRKMQNCIKSHLVKGRVEEYNALRFRPAVRGNSGGLKKDKSSDEE